MLASLFAQIHSVNAGHKGTRRSNQNAPDLLHRFVNKLELQTALSCLDGALSRWQVLLVDSGNSLRSTTNENNGLS
jgi:hypothetical protein